jgi:hypothetical protein
MKQRFLFFAVPLVALLLVVTLVSTSQVSSQEPGAVQQVEVADDTQPHAPAAPTSLLFSYQGQLLDASGNPITNLAMPMIFRLYTAASGGTACWSESRTIDVRNGVFSVLLGQTVAINSSCLIGDSWLEIVVAGETLTPRERLTSVAHAVEASTLSAGAVTRGGISLGGPIDMRHDAIVNLRAVSAPSDAHLDIMWGQSQDMFVKSSANGNLYVGMGGNVNVGVSGNLSTGGDLMIGGNDLTLKGRNSGGTGGAGRALVDGGTGAGLMINYGNDFGSWSIAGPSNAQLNMGGNSIVNCGALVEANLQTLEEIQEGRIDRFEQGDLLCWSTKDQQLDLCRTANDPLIMAVGDSEGRPIVLGAEPVKVFGPVQAGDYLVASHVPGYAMAARTPSFGIVIAQALESFDGEQGLIKAMIRKM